MRALILILLISLTVDTAYPQLKRLAVIGSSTAFGQGASPAIDSSWVRKINYRYKYQEAVVDTVVNLAMGGYDPYHALPGWYTPAQYYSVPDPERNITKANSFNPNVIIVSFVSNNFGIPGIPMDSIMKVLQLIKDSANIENRVCFITTSQPRTVFNEISRQNLRVIKDSILNRFGFYAINFFDSIVNNADNTILAAFNSGDGTHLNNAGHAMLYRQVLAKDIFNITTTRTRKSGNFNDRLTWDKGIIPTPADSVAVLAGQTLTINSSVQVRGLYIEEGASVVINNGVQLQVGDISFNNNVITNEMLTNHNDQFSNNSRIFATFNSMPIKNSRQSSSGSSVQALLNAR